MTLLFERDLTTVKMYLHAENELFRSNLSKVRALYKHRDRQADRQMRLEKNITTGGSDGATPGRAIQMTWLEDLLCFGNSVNGQ